MHIPGSLLDGSQMDRNRSYTYYTKGKHVDNHKTIPLISINRRTLTEIMNNLGVC